MSVRKKLLKAVFFTIVTVVLGISSVIEADKRRTITH